MSEQTKIEWCDHTWNPWRGCTKVSPGCANCYAETLSRRNPAVLGQWGKGKPRVKAKNWGDPVRWNAKPVVCDACGSRTFAPQPHGCPVADPAGYHRARVFPSLCDWLDDEVPIEWLAEFLRLIHETPNLTWLLLSKRPENWYRRIRDALWTIEGLPLDDSGDGEGLPATEIGSVLNDWLSSPGIPPANVWIGASVEDQRRADERIPELLKIPARVHFLSAEPLLGPVNLRCICLPQTKHEGGWTPIMDALTGFYGTSPVSGADGPKIDWVIIGGESGPGARPCHTDWVRDIVRQCDVAGVKPFVKQLGRDPQWEAGDIRAWCHERFSHPKGGDPSEWPADLRRREFPEVVR
jgi:protein gp37